MCVWGGEGGRWLETRNRNSQESAGQGSPEATAPGLGIHGQVGATFAAFPAWPLGLDCELAPQQRPLSRGLVGAGLGGDRKAHFRDEAAEA